MGRVGSGKIILLVIIKNIQKMTIDFRCVVKFGVGVGYQIELIANLNFENSLKKKSPILKIKISFEVIFFSFLIN